MPHPNSKRVPLNRSHHYFPPDALAVFRQMQNLEIERPRNWCKQWHHLNNELHSALDMYPWQIPAVMHPDTVVADTDQRNRVWGAAQAMQLYRALQSAVQIGSGAGTANFPINRPAFLVLFSAGLVDCPTVRNLSQLLACAGLYRPQCATDQILILAPIEAWRPGSAGGEQY